MDFWRVWATDGFRSLPHKHAHTHTHTHTLSLSLSLCLCLNGKNAPRQNSHIVTSSWRTMEWVCDRRTCRDSNTVLMQLDERRFLGNICSKGWSLQNINGIEHKYWDTPPISHLEARLNVFFWFLVFSRARCPKMVAFCTHSLFIDEPVKSPDPGCSLFRWRHRRLRLFLS